VIDSDFRWLAINKASADEFQRIYGVRPRPGDSVLDRLEHLPEQQAAVAAAWRRALDGEAFTEMADVDDASGARRCYEIKYNALHDAAGRLIAAYQFVYDVTDRIREQERLAAAEEQLRQSQKMEAVGQLTGGVAHDFNNLLMPITGALDMLGLRYGEDPKTAKLVGGALQSAERAKTLVQRLLGFARRQALETRAVDLAELVHGMRDLIASSVGAAIELRIVAPADLPAALVDPNQLELAILNLCVNARDAMPTGGVLTIAVSQVLVGPRDSSSLAPGVYLQLAVVDTGTGMDAETLARAMEPFYSTKGLGKGTGLGLSMVHGLAAQLGGDFSLASELGKGTRANLHLPVARTAASALKPARPDAGPWSRSLSILLVDDEELVRTGTAEMLRDLGHRVAEAASGAQALALLSSGDPTDVLVTDYMMPRMNGAELVHRAREIQPGLAALVITGYAGGDVDIGLPKLAKPFRQADLSAALRALIEPPANVVRLPTRGR
jgi:signal transduction histidine kinase